MPRVPNRAMLSIPNDVTRRARARAISEGTSMSAIVTRFLRAWLAGEIEVPVAEPEKEIKSKKQTKRIK